MWKCEGRVTEEKSKRKRVRKIYIRLLQEVVGDVAANVGLATARSRVKLQEGVLQVLVYLHDGSLVATAVAVIWGTENRDDIAILAPVVALKVIGV